MRVYISGPYTADPEACTAAAIDAAARIIAAGHTPYVPHLHHFIHKVHPQLYETWMRIDLAFVPLCHALVRLHGDSPGAEREVELADRVFVKVFQGVDPFLIYAREKHPQKAHTYGRLSRFLSLMDLPDLGFVSPAARREVLWLDTGKGERQFSRIKWVDRSNHILETEHSFMIPLAEAVTYAIGGELCAT